MAKRQQVPLLLLTGFLGSGKTTLLRNWLADPAFARTMVLVNEIGEVGVDQQLLAPLAGDPLLLENGCACCDAGGDLVAALEQMFFDRLHRKIPPFTRVVIETTGLAAPSSILQLLNASEILRDRYKSPFVLTTLDATHGPSQFERHPEVRDQVEVADAIVLTRTDLASDDVLEACSALVARSRPDITVRQSGRAPLSAQTVLDLLAHPPSRNAAGTVATVRGARHSEGVSTGFAPAPNVVTRLALTAALETLFSQAGSSLLRLKGIVVIDGAGPCSVQADGSETKIEPVGAAAERLGLTLIAQGRSAPDLAASLAAKLVLRKLGAV